MYRSPLLRLRGALALFALLLCYPAAPAAAQRKKAAAPAASATVAVDSTALAALKYRHIGPAGNRVTSVAGVIGDGTVYYAGAASGGLWKTSDAGVHWKAMFDGQPVSSIGSVTVAPSDPNVVWVGTGEPFIRSHISEGWGMFKSIDAGTTWTRAGLENTGRIARIVIDPRDPERVYVAALGHSYGPQPERGIFRTTDGGKSWTKVLFVNDSTGACDIVIDPNNSHILYAGFWQLEIHTWGRTSGGAGSSIWKSTDGGSTWTRLVGHGLPTRPYGKVGLGISKANSDRIYALVETGDGIPRGGVEQDHGRLFRSDDAGATWQLVSSDLHVAGRTHYYNRMGVEPDNADEVYFLNANYAKTVDGGKTITDVPFEHQPGGDHHDIWIDPTDGNRQVVSFDDGVAITINRGKTWLRLELPIAQMYHVAVDNRIPYYVYGNRQDGPSAMGPSNSKLAPGPVDASIPIGVWRTVGGGESGWAQPDTVDTNLVWSTASGYGSAGGIVTRYDTRTSIARQVEIWPEGTLGHAADSLKYRFQWTFPLTISPHDHNLVYAGSQYVHATTDGGQSWHEISPDLTRNDKSRQRVSGGLTPDNVGVEYSGVVFAIAESPREKGLLWVGTNDGVVQLSRDGGKTWTNLSANLPQLLPWGTISNIEPSRYDAAVAYLTVDGHQVNNRDPWIYKTADYGKSWKLIVNGIPKSPLSYAHVVKEDPVRRGLLYAGTENALYVSFDDGANWRPLQNNLPHAPVYWIVVQEHFHDLVIATYGRGFWILDDITPLRTMGSEVMAKELHLFKPRDAYRFRYVEPPFAHTEDPVAGQNPPPGASLTFWLKSAATDSVARSKDSVTLSIADAAGTVVRTLKAPATAGLSRVWWDLAFELTKEARVRTPPRYSPWITVPFEGVPAPGIGRTAMLAPPGAYTVTLSHGGKEERQPLVLLKDPSSGATDADIKAQTELLNRVQGDLDTTVTMINEVELARAQIANIKQATSTDAKAIDVRAAADTLDQALIMAEEKLFQLRTTGRGQDILRWPSRLAEQLLYLAQGLGTSDYAPTESQRAVGTLLHEEVQASRAQVQQLMTRDVAAFNEMLRGKRYGNVIVGGKPDGGAELRPD